MPRHLHLVGPDASALAASVIGAEAEHGGATVTVALLGVTRPPVLPPGVSVVAVDPDGPGYAALLDLIFESDRVTAW